MKFYKNVDICDLESILEKGILSAEKAKNFHWGEGNRSENAYNVVYLFSPLGRRNAFTHYGAALLAAELDPAVVKENEMLLTDSNRGEYIEYITKEVTPDQISAVYIPELFKEKCNNLPASVLEKITWCGMEEEGVTLESLSLLVEDMVVLNSTAFNYFRGFDENGFTFDFYKTVYAFPGYDTEERASSSAKPYEPQKEIITETGEIVVIAADTQTLWFFSNKEKKASYSAKIIKNGQRTTRNIEWEERKTLNDAEEKLNAKCNPIRSAYSKMIQRDRTKHDPDGKIWAKIVAFVKENESDFFTKTGDFRKNIKKDAWERLEASAKSENC